MHHIATRIIIIQQFDKETTPLYAMSSERCQCQFYLYNTFTLKSVTYLLTTQISSFSTRQISQI